METELLFLNKRCEGALERIAKIESATDQIAKITAAAEDMHCTDRREQHAAMQVLMRRTEDSLLTLDTLQKRQESSDFLFHS